MKLIVPMAGRGTRLRPHTHVTPKPLLPVLGASMVERIVKTFKGVLPQGLGEAVFILGPDFGQEVRDRLTEICSKEGITAHFGVQEQALGTAHAVYQAGDHLQGEVVVVFADTLFYMDEQPDLDADAVIWVKTVDDPRRFGVVVKEGDRITDFVEKPATPISNEAIIGIYYMKEGERLQREIAYLMEHDVTGHGGEYQLTDALDRMLKDGAVFKTAAVTDWLDCGTIPALKETTGIVLGKDGEARTEGTLDEAVLIQPVYLGPGATVRRSVVGPNVSIEAGAVVEDSVVKDAILFAHSHVTGSRLADAVVGHHAQVSGVCGALNIGDHATAGQVG